MPRGPTPTWATEAVCIYSFLAVHTHMGYRGCVAVHTHMGSVVHRPPVQLIQYTVMRRLRGSRAVVLPRISAGSLHDFPRIPAGSPQDLHVISQCLPRARGAPSWALEPSESSANVRANCERVLAGVLPSSSAPASFPPPPENPCRGVASEGVASVGAYYYYYHYPREQVPENLLLLENPLRVLLLLLSAATPFSRLRGASARLARAAAA